MSHQSPLIERDIEAYLAAHEQKELLRFLTCGSVDDGKSTLIGRLLYDSKMIYEDQLASIRKDSVTHGNVDGDFDPALLTDGLKAEREQGITIDVAYRYFSTERRKFIIADTPGHEQYTRNMATGASTCDLAIILVDARHGIVTQTKRHSFIVSLLGLKHVLVAINKMDLVDYDQNVFDKITAEYRTLAESLDIPDITFLPLSALKGDNVVEPSQNMPWFSGQTLMSFLETVNVTADGDQSNFRFPVQIVTRPNLSFRGFAGTIASGVVRPGDEVMVLPSRRKTKIHSIVTFDGQLEAASAPMAVTLTVADQVDISRGDMLVHPQDEPLTADAFEAHLVWMGESPMRPGREYLFKQSTRSSPGRVRRLTHLIDVNTMAKMPGSELGLNEIARCEVLLDTPIAFDPYADNRTTGSFIVIDRLSNETVGAGMIQNAIASDVTYEETPVTAAERAARFGHTPAIVGLTGADGGATSTLATRLERNLFDKGRSVLVLRPGDWSTEAKLAQTVAALTALGDAGAIVLLVVPPNQDAASIAGAVPSEQWLTFEVDPDERSHTDRVRSIADALSSRRTPNISGPSI